MKLLNSRVVWSGKWRVRVDTFQLPDGSLYERGAVEHPGAVVLVPLLAADDGSPTVLMLRQFRPALGQTILELPAGTRDPQEAWLECAQRELREETGHRATELVSLGEIWPAPGLSNERMALYLAIGLAADPLPMDIDEEIAVEMWRLDELVEMALDGRLEDAKSVAAVLRTAHYLAQSAG